jgi:hypothetical protein
MTASFAIFEQLKPMGDYRRTHGVPKVDIVWT